FDGQHLHVAGDLFTFTLVHDLEGRFALVVERAMHEYHEMRLDGDRHWARCHLGELHAPEIDAGRRTRRFPELDGVDEHRGDDPHPAPNLPACPSADPGPIDRQI